MRERSLAVIVRHEAAGSNALRAALTARSMSLALPATHWAMTSSRAGSKTSNVPPESPSTHSPPISSFLGLSRKDAASSCRNSLTRFFAAVPLVVAVAGIGCSSSRRPRAFG